MSCRREGPDGHKTRHSVRATCLLCRRRGTLGRAAAVRRHRPRALARDLAHPRRGWDRADRRMQGSRQWA
jgi:hypothetical protein